MLRASRPKTGRLKRPQIVVAACKQPHDMSISQTATMHFEVIRFSTMRPVDCEDSNYLNLIILNLLNVVL